MIVVTGGAGFIGSNLVRALVAEGREVVVVDDAAIAGRATLDGVAVADRIGHREFLDRVERRPADALASVEAVLHQGACTSTTEDDEDLLTATNVTWSLAVVDACLLRAVPVVYASSAAVYGPGPAFAEDPSNEQPLNPYARSKAQLDAEVRARLATGATGLVGLRYFNVYGPGEAHKGPMASTIRQFTEQVLASGTARVFGEGEGAPAGAHRRDFVHVDDVVAVVRWFLGHPDRAGIYNVGTGRARSFAEVADLVVGALGRGEVATVAFPDHLRGRYQARTEADLTALRAAGCDHRFEPIERGIPRYVADLLAERPGGAAR